MSKFYVLITQNEKVNFCSDIVPIVLSETECETFLKEENLIHHRLEIDKPIHINNDILIRVK